MAYTKTAWVNDAPPDIDADNLNKMEQGIYDAQFPEGGSDGQLLSKTATGLGWVNPPNSAVWGGITGTLSNQSDLNNALGAKANASTLATVESSSTASRAYSVGSYLVYNGILYRVTAAISSGQTLTPGTNITATNAGAELTSLNNDLSETNSTVSRLSIFQSGWIAASGVSNLDLLPVNNVFGVFWLNNTDSGIGGTKPSSEGMGLLFNLRQSSTICRQVYIGITNSSNYVRYYAYSTGTWAAWSAVTI